jgi:hypothetical protein
LLRSRAAIFDRLEQACALFGIDRVVDRQELDFRSLWQLRAPSRIGLEQAGGAASPDASWSWHGGAAVTQRPWSASEPDTLSGSGFSDDACTTSHAFLIQP